MSRAIHGRYLQELQEQAKSTSPPDAARRLSLCELGSAAPRPLRKLEGAGSNGVLKQNTYVLLCRTPLGFCEEPLPLGAHRKITKGQNGCGPVFYRVVWASRTKIPSLF